MATVMMSPAAKEQFDDLPRPIQARVLKIFERLSDWPDVSGAKALKGDLAGKHRIRTGDYRVQFSAKAETVMIDKIGHRDGFYDE